MWDNRDAGQAFVVTELETCELFMTLAVDASSTEARARRLDSARKAFESATRFLPLVHFSRDVLNEMQERLAAAGEALRDLRETPAELA